MKTLLIFEPYAAGHRMLYVRHLADAARRRGGLRIVLLTREASQSHPAVVELLQNFPGLLALVTIDADPDHAGMNQLLWENFWVRTIDRELRRLGQRERIDHLLIPFLDDYCIHAAAVRYRPFGNIPWSGIVIRPRHHLRKSGGQVPFRWIDMLDRMAYSLLLRKKSLVRIFSIDPYLSEYYSHDKVATVPDPADLAGRPASALPPELVAHGASQGDRVILLVYGYIDGRKGLQELLAAANHHDVPAPLHVMLAGFQDPAVRDTLNSPAAQALRAAGRLVEINRVITDEEEAALFRFSDIVWVYYPRSYCSSGALIRAGQCAKPVMATREGLVGRLVSEYGTGLTAPVGDVAALRTALAALANDAQLRHRQGLAGQARFSGSTSAAFAEPIIDSIIGSFTASADVR